MLYHSNRKNYAYMFTTSKTQKQQQKMKKLNFSINEARAIAMLEKTLNVASAADALDVSSNALNISISRVEQKIGKSLFVRKQKTGEVTLSPGSEFILDYMKTIMGAADLIEDKDQTWSEDPTTGQLTLRTTQTMMEYIIGPHFVDFINKHPRLNVSFKQQDDLSNHSASSNEISITACTEMESEYEYFPFHSFAQRYWASKKYLERFGTPKTMEDLFHHRILLQHTLKDPRMLFGSCPTMQMAHPGDIKGYEVHSARVCDFLCESGLGVMGAFDETVKLSKLKVENVFPKIKGEKVDLFVRVNRQFLKAPVARYFINWLFECRDKTLGGIQTKPSFPHKKLIP